MSFDYTNKPLPRLPAGAGLPIESRCSEKPLPPLPPEAASSARSAALAGLGRTGKRIEQTVRGNLPSRTEDQASKRARQKNGWRKQQSKLADGNAATRGSPDEKNSALKQLKGLAALKYAMADAEAGKHELKRQFRKKISRVAAVFKTPAKTAASAARDLTARENRPVTPVGAGKPDLETATEAAAGQQATSEFVFLKPREVYHALEEMRNGFILSGMSGELFHLLKNAALLHDGVTGRGSHYLKLPDNDGVLVMTQRDQELTATAIALSDEGLGRLVHAALMLATQQPQRVEWDVATGSDMAMRGQEGAIVYTALLRSREGND